MRALTLPVARYEALALQERANGRAWAFEHRERRLLKRCAERGWIETRAFIATASPRACALQYGRVRVSTLYR